MTSAADDSFLAWERSRQRLATLELELQLAAVQRADGDAAPGCAAMATEVTLLKAKTQELYQVALAAHRGQAGGGKPPRKSQLSRARRLA